MQVLDQEQDAGSAVGPAGSDVVELPLVPEGDKARVVDAVSADAVVGVGGTVAWDGFGPGGVGSGRGCAAFPSSERYGRRVLQVLAKASSWAWSSARVAG